MTRFRLAKRARGAPRRLVGCVRDGRLFDDSLDYAIREFLPGSRTAFHVPRGSDHGLLLRHHTADVLIVKEIFALHLYEPPPVVRSALVELARPPRVLDLGGHIGLFGAFILTVSPLANLLSLEPDPQSFAVLSANARRSRCNWTVLPVAAAAKSGWVPFRATGGPDSGLTRSESGSRDEHETEVLGIDVLPLLRHVDLAKFDIEGGEWPILSDPRWAGSAPDILAIEFHPEGCPSSDFQAAAIDAVEAAGMNHSLIAGTPVGAGMLWAWRRP